MKKQKTIDKVTNIKEKELKYSIKFGKQECVVKIEDALTGMVNDQGEVILDEIIIDNFINELKKVVINNHTKYNDYPVEIDIRKHKKNVQMENKNISINGDKHKSETDVQVVLSREARFDLEQVCLSKPVLDQIKTTLSAIKNKSRLCNEWGMAEHFTNRAIILNFYGKPGTGKSMAAEAIAKKLGKKVYSVNYAELESKYVGETPKNIKKAFEIAKRDNAVLIFDEADSFLGKRLTSVTQSSDYGVNITRSVLLMELENFDGVVVFTTNLLSNYDEAFKRRILASVFFDLPDKECRSKIWKYHLGKNIPLKGSITCDILAQKYINISGADIKDIVFYAAIRTMELEEEQVTIEIFDYAYSLIMQRYKDDSNHLIKTVREDKISEEQYQKEIERYDR